MDNDYFLDAGIPPLLHYEQPTWHSLPPTGLQFPAPPTTDGFLESALSSIVSSPGSNDGFAIRELIGKLGNICNSGDPNYAGSSILPAVPGDSGLAERAARFSSLRSRSFNCRSSQAGSGLPPNAPAQLNPGRKLHRILSSPSLKLEMETQRQNDTKVNGISDQGHFRNSEEKSSETGSRPASGSSKKRKSKQLPSSAAQANQTRTDPTAKRAKSTQDKEDNNNKNEAEAEPPKDYIHVRARRGQATDSHSLAERVRREKISERMKLLQDIVPGCNKVTGKALMLEEIINYVQSLQRQVEYLSMKLASTPPTIEFNTSNHFQNDIFQPNCSMPQLDAYGMDQSLGIQLPATATATDAFMNDVNELQINSLCEGDLLTIVDMGFRDNTLYTG